MPKASELKKGDVIQLGGAPHMVRQLEARSPSSRGAATLYKIRFTNLISGQKRDESLKGDDFLPEAECQRTEVQYSYMDGEQYVFMSTQDYTQYGLSADDLEDQVHYLVEGLAGITALIADERILAIDLPQSVVMQVSDTAPAIKGGTASARTKPATLTTGLVVQVPEYIATGESLKVNTSNGKFMSRA